MGKERKGVKQLDPKKLRSSVAIYREHKKLMLSIEVLDDYGIVLPLERVILEAQAKMLYEAWKFERRKFTRPPGRPKKVETPRPTKCKRPGCTNPPAPEQVYCSRECAPLGFFGVGIGGRGRKLG